MADNHIKKPERMYGDSNCGNSYSPLLSPVGAGSTLTGLVVLGVMATGIIAYCGGIHPKDSLKMAIPLSREFAGQFVGSTGQYADNLGQTLITYTHSNPYYEVHADGSEVITVRNDLLNLQFYINKEGKKDTTIDIIVTPDFELVRGDESYIAHLDEFYSADELLSKMRKNVP